MDNTTWTSSATLQFVVTKRLLLQRTTRWQCCSIAKVMLTFWLSAREIAREVREGGGVKAGQREKQQIKKEESL